MENEIKKSLGLKMQALRKNARLTQEDLAELCDVSWRTISNLERGLVMSELKLILKTSKIFNLSLDELFDVELKMKKSLSRLKKEAEICEKISTLNDADLDYIYGVIELSIRYKKRVD